MNDENLAEQKKEFSVARYQGLYELWTHHNTTQLQWPPVVVSAALIVISLTAQNISSGKFNNPTDPCSWGSSDLALYIGIPLLLTGLALIFMLYAMGRARRMMNLIEEEIGSLENDFVNINNSFKDINRIKGYSATKLLRFFMAFFFALPLTLAGLLLSLGFPLGPIVWAIIIALWIGLEYYPLYSKTA